MTCHSHVALGPQCDVAHLQHDVAGLFSPFSELKGSFLPQPCRVEGPMRRGSCPTRRGRRFFALFRAKRGCSAAAMSRWKPNATWRSSNTTSRGPTSPLSLSLINFLYGAGDVVGGFLLGELVDGVLGEDVLAYDGGHGGFGLVLGDVRLGVAQANLLRLTVCGREIHLKSLNGFVSHDGFLLNSLLYSTRRLVDAEDLGHLGLGDGVLNQGSNSVAHGLDVLGASVLYQVGHGDILRLLVLIQGLELEDALNI